MKLNIPISTWQEHHEAVSLRFTGTSEGQGARAVDSVEGEALLQLTLRAHPARPVSATPEQVRKSLRPPWWA